MHFGSDTDFTLASYTLPTIRRNEKDALRQAFTPAFPEAHIVSCQRHLRTKKKADKVGLPSKQHQHTIHNLFGQDSMLVYAKDPVQFQFKTDANFGAELY